ncbi:MAG: HDOD domain-containing protein, partial [Thermodesulfobacteriota bacterium]|nr:HDOD domain-containing protein [Thermodesulfobacteriota bacterium]
KIFEEKNSLLRSYDLFFIGLLHDLGKPLLTIFLEEPYQGVFEIIAQEGLTTHEAEQRILGINHAEAGMMLAKKWKFPPSVIEGIALHHNPASVNGESHIRQAIAAIHLSDIIVWQRGLDDGISEKSPSPHDEALKILNITSEDLDVVASQFESKQGELQGLVDTLNGLG